MTLVLALKIVMASLMATDDDRCGVGRAAAAAAGGDVDAVLCG